MVGNAWKQQGMFIVYAILAIAAYVLIFWWYSIEMKKRNAKYAAAARAYGQHMDIIHDMDLIILAPQMDSMKDNLKEIADHDGSKLVTTTERQYIELTQNPDKAFKFVVDSLAGKNDEKKDEDTTGSVPNATV